MVKTRPRANRWKWGTVGALRAVARKASVEREKESTLRGTAEGELIRLKVDGSKAA